MPNPTQTFEEPSPTSDAEFRLELALLPEHARSILDVGCGDGRLVRHLSAQTRVAIGVDVSLAELRRACREARSSSKANACFVAADACRLPFRDGAFDYVVSAYALHHTDLDETLPEVRRVVATSGRLLLRDVIAWLPRMQRHAWWHVPFNALQALRFAARNGPRAALAHFRARRSPSAIAHMTRANRLLTPTAYLATHRRWLPGCRVLRKPPGIVFWDARPIVWDVLSEDQGRMR